MGDTAQGITVLWTQEVEGQCRAGSPLVRRHFWGSQYGSKKLALQLQVSDRSGEKLLEVKRCGVYPQSQRNRGRLAEGSSAL